MTGKKKILAKLFFSTLYLSAFTFGGGYVIVTLMKQKFVDERSLLTTTISNGRLVCALLPFLIITVISYFYELFRDNYVVGSVLSGMQSGVGAVIASVVIDMGGGVLKQRSVLSIVVMLTAFIATYVYKVNAVYIILACIAIGVVRTVITQRRNAQ